MKVKNHNISTINTAKVDRTLFMHASQNKINGYILMNPATICDNTLY